MHTSGRPCRSWGECTSLDHPPVRETRGAWNAGAAARERRGFAARARAAASHPVGVCAHPVGTADRLLRCMSVASVVMDVDARRMWLSDAPLTPQDPEVAGISHALLSVCVRRQAAPSWTSPSGLHDRVAGPVCSGRGPAAAPGFLVAAHSHAVPDFSMRVHERVPEGLEGVEVGVAERPGAAGLSSSMVQ
jgi:hypothetical protein